MNCTQCGAESPDNAKFCGLCGATLPSATPPSATPPSETPPDTGTSRAPKGAVEAQSPSPFSPPGSRGKMAGFFAAVPKKVWLFAGGFLVLTVLVVILVSSLFGGGGKYTAREHNMLFFAGEGKTEVFSGGRTLTLDGELGAYAVSLDGAKAAVMTGESGDRTLWYINDMKALKIARKVYTFILSDSGDGVAYVSDVGKEFVGTLNLYRDGQSAIVADGNVISYYCISPDGKTLGYSYKSNDTTFSYLWNGKNTELTQNDAPICVSDGGKYVYFIRYRGSDYSFWVKKGRKEERLCELAPDVLYLNRDYSQALYAKNARCRISRDGGEGTAVGEDMKALLLPDNVQVLLKQTMLLHLDRGGWPLNHSVVGLKSFVDTLYSGADGSLLRISKRFESEPLVRDLDAVEGRLSADGKTAYYVKGNALYRIDTVEIGANPIRLALDTRTFAFLNGGAVCYRTDDGDLYYMKDAEPKKIASGVGTSLAVPEGSKRVFYTVGGELYRSDSGGKPKKVAVEGEVFACLNVGKDVFYLIDKGVGRFDVYLGNKNARFTLLYTDVSLPRTSAR